MSDSDKLDEVARVIGRLEARQEQMHETIKENASLLMDLDRRTGKLESSVKVGSAVIGGISAMVMSVGVDLAKSILKG
ncbi:hypothetical protein SIID45300_01756 [Candidatus Magnetaquicoccaceae bacterium FCR-1]|uniref:Uncharacterized protein n=1 Tax=Candidatus Magnetaquiglobus chichijimensis TaxID=3141448 RepID=A0ABQ0C967_9PROT